MDIKFLGWIAINGDFLAWVFLTVFFSGFWSGTVLLTGELLFSETTGDLYFTSNFLTGSTSESGSSGVGAMSGGVGLGAGGKHWVLIGGSYESYFILLVEGNFEVFGDVLVSGYFIS